MKFDFENAKQDDRDPVGGWCKGGYTCTCIQCKSSYFGDKRSWECADCAYELTKGIHRKRRLEDQAYQNTMSKKDHALLLRGARSLLPRGRRKTMPNWVLAMQLFMVGSTYGNRICIEAGVDPDGAE